MHVTELEFKGDCFCKYNIFYVCFTLCHKQITPYGPVDVGLSVCRLFHHIFTTLEQILAMMVLAHNAEKMALSYTVVTRIQDHTVATVT
jgi:hypothetical protein